MCTHPYVSMTFPSVVLTSLEGSLLTMKGPLGVMTFNLAHFDPTGTLGASLIHTEQGSTLHLSVHTDGDSLTIIQSTLRNAIHGVAQGFLVELEAKGVGYKILREGNTMSFKLGLSHTVATEVPKDVVILNPHPQRMMIFGMDKQRVHSIVAQLRALRPPEVYKGKGLVRKGESLRRKEGKKK